MATANDIVKRAMRLIHVLDPDEEPSASEAEDSLTAFNMLIDSWIADRAYVYAIREDTVSWAANAQSQTIGPTGDFAITRPVRLADSTFYTVNNQDYILPIATTRVAYTSIAEKSVKSSHPLALYYEPTHPDGTLYIWPVPTVTLEVNLHSWQQLTELANLTTTIQFPPGYQHAFANSLAEELAPEFGVAVPPEVTKAAYKARLRIKRLNRPVKIAQVEVGHFQEGHGFNVFIGD